MSLTTTPKIDWDTSDGVADTDMNEIGVNLNALESSKHQDGDSPTYVNVTVTNDITYNSKQITSDNYLHADTTQDVVFDKLSPFLPNIGDTMMMTGGGETSTGAEFIISRAERNSATVIRFYIYSITSSVTSTTDATNGSATSIKISASW